MSKINLTYGLPNGSEGMSYEGDCVFCGCSYFLILFLQLPISSNNGS